MAKIRVRKGKKLSKAEAEKKARDANRKKRSKTRIKVTRKK